ncbi:MAG: hypothetical protein LAO77_14730 [Acidobacteriia bacterium]|nr:hypothetical protein [Terriglobia bacterium]
MSFVRHPFAALLVLVLLCVPSLTRVYQQLDQRSTAATLTASFSKSADCPPSKILIDMPRPVASSEPLAAPTPTIERVCPVADRDPVPSPETAPPEALRAPPLA